MLQDSLKSDLILLNGNVLTMDANNTHRFKIKYYKNREKSWTKTKDLAAQLIPGAGTGIKETQDARNFKN